MLTLTAGLVIGASIAARRNGGTGGDGGGLDVLSEVVLDPDGPLGIDTYDLIRGVLGPSAIEAPDLWSTNHPGFQHIIEQTGGPTGAYFTFFIHGTDGDKEDPLGRSRNEIKVDGNSADSVKGFQNDIVRYHWYFRVPVSYQIVGDDYVHQIHNRAAGPIVKLMVRSEELRVTYDPDNQNINETVIAATSLTPLRGQWLEAEEIILLADGGQGYYELTVRDQGGAIALQTVQPSLDLWTPSDFTRPKWGWYRPRNSAALEGTLDIGRIILQKLGSLL